MEHWCFKITIKYQDLNCEYQKFIDKMKRSFSSSVSVNQDALNTVIEGWGLTDNEVSRLYDLMPTTLQTKMVKVSRRCNDTIQAYVTKDASSLHEALTLLNSGYDYIHAGDEWHIWSRLPFESFEEHHKRLVDLIPIQTVMIAISEIKVTEDTVFDHNLDVLIGDFSLDVLSYLNALKYRERRKMIPLARRILDNAKKQQALKLLTYKYILEADLKTCL